MKTLKNCSRILIGAATLAWSTGCEVDTQHSQVSLQEAAPEAPVCDPFGNGASEGDGNGLWARLRYLPASSPRYESVHDYMTYGIDPGVDLIFNQLNTPTRPFDRGFIRTDGTVIQTETGDTLYEWFGLHFESKVKLAAGDNPGKYQFAVLSDDGSILSISESGEETDLAEVVNNNVVTGTRMKCATRTVRLDGNSRLPISVDYFQGPRHHIALIVLWREIPESANEVVNPSVLDDSSCDTMGNDLFFDSTQNPPEPQQAFIGLLSRGWKVLSPSNYELHDRHRPSANLCGGVIGT